MYDTSTGKYLISVAQKNRATWWLYINGNDTEAFVKTRSGKLAYLRVRTIILCDSGHIASTLLS